MVVKHAAVVYNGGEAAVVSHTTGSVLHTIDETY